MQYTNKPHLEHTSCAHQVPEVVEELPEAETLTCKQSKEQVHRQAKAHLEGGQDLNG